MNASIKEPPHEEYPDPHHDVYSKTIFGFWIYLLTDFILFGVLIATYVVMQHSVFGGPSAKDLFNLHFSLVQTLVLLTSSFTIALGNVYAHRRKKNPTLFYYLLSFVLGLVFMIMMHLEFSRLIDMGASWKFSAFLSAYFTLVGTLGLHMIFALLWVFVLLFPVMVRGIHSVNVKRLTCLRMFWQFLNIVWIFIFTIVYLLGVK